MEKYFIGVTRFSTYIPKSKAWQLSRDLDVDQYLSTLFDDERLSVRFDIFFDRALPVYQYFYENFNYLHIVFYSELMPSRWLEKLKDKASAYPFLSLVEVVDDSDFDLENHSALISDYFQEPSGPLSVFRVDDDDILSSDYLHSLSKYTVPCFSGMCITYGKGLIGVYSDGGYQIVREVRRHSLALGMAFVGHIDSYKLNISSWRQNHTSVAEKSPVVIDAREKMYMWTQHSGQDTKLLGSNSMKDKVFFDYSVCESLDFLSHKFPTLERDFSLIERRRDVVASMNLEELKGKRKFDVFLDSGYYEIEYSISKGLSKKCPRTAIIYFGECSVKSTGLYESAKENIGCYHYIGSEKKGFNVVKFKLEEPVDKGFFLSRWSEKNVITFDFFRVVKVC